MLRLPPTGLKSRHLVAKSVRSCLPEGLPYNWDEKLRGLIVGICLSRSLLLQSIAQTRPGNVRTGENNLSSFLGQLMLEFARRGGTAAAQSLMKRFLHALRSRFARPSEELTMGRLMRLLAMDFPSPRLAGEVP